jgi:myo-inositol-1(or 4)-monophosphatase
MSSEHLQFAIRLARQTGDILLEYFRSVKLNTNLKSDNSIVTEADLTADKFIAESINKTYPNDLLLSEELQTRYSVIDQEAGNVVWIVDPLDGTTNFSLGFQFWGVLIARVKDGTPNTAVLYFPLLDECYSTQLGQGAYLNGDQIHVETPSKDRPKSFFACCSRTFRRYKVSVPYKTRILGSAAYTFCALARGIAILGFEATPKIWDISGAWLLVREAGGIIETLDGSHPFPLKSNLDYAHENYPTLAAANRKIAISARSQIIPR